MIDKESEMRFDPMQKRWVIIAPLREKRATDFVRSNNSVSRSENCPFCPGNEAHTSQEITRYNTTSTEKREWSVRVIANRYRALGTNIQHLGREAEGIYDKMNGIGAHEVVIESREHSLSMADFSHEQLVLVLKMYRERLIDLMKDLRLRYVLIFKNYGEHGGATLQHPHSQIIATPITPKTVAIELETSKEHFKIKERCLLCDIIRQEVLTGERVIYDDGAFISYAPYASRFPFEMMLAPRTHGSDFGALTDHELGLLANCIKITLGKLKYGLEDPHYNFVLHTSPNPNAIPKRPGYWVTLGEDYHWHLEIIPRLTMMAGFEWGTGFYINPTPPEKAAKFLREVKFG